jgi:signal transduction histidine kinase
VRQLFTRQGLFRVRWLLEPALGVLILVLALVVRQGGDGALVSVILLAAAVALSRSLPAVALGAASVGVLVLVGVLTPSSAGAGVGWTAYVALLVVVVGIAAHGRSVTRWLALAGAILVGPVGAFVVVVRSGGLAAGGVLGSSHGSAPVRFLLIALVLSIGQATVWLLGTLWRQRRTSAELSSLPSAVSTAPVGDVLFAGVFFLLLSASGNGTDTIAMLVLLGLTIALAVRRLAPPVALGIAWFAAIGQMLGGGGVQPADLAILGVLYATAAYGDRVTRWAGLASAGLGALVAALYLTLWNEVPALYFTALSSRLGELALRFLYLIAVSATVLGLSWVLGMLARTWRNARASRRAQAAAEEERRRAEQSVVVEQERNRIARDMHDVVAHSLAVVIAQADGARYARRAGSGSAGSGGAGSGSAGSDDAGSDSVDEALTTISTTARQALGDVRLLLGELRHSEGNGPQPSLDDLDGLVGQMRSAGLPVRAVESGVRPQVGSALQIVIYRIAQEALTNALRHGNTEEGAQMALDWEDTTVSLTVTNAIAPKAKDASAGHGLPGMRERAALVGGQLATSGADGVFTVSARLPTGVVRDGSAT